MALACAVFAQSLSLNVAVLLEKKEVLHSDLMDQGQLEIQTLFEALNTTLHVQYTRRYVKLIHSGLSL